jgi:hypothetical protein
LNLIALAVSRPDIRTGTFVRSLCDPHPYHL